MRMFQSECTHLDQIRDVEPSAYGCEQWLQMDDTWVHVRGYLVCGHVGCCDSSVSLGRRNYLSFRATLSLAGAVGYSMTT
jgi:hypothetical protein